MISERMTIRGESTRHALIRRVALTLFRLAIGAGLLVYLAKSGIIDFGALSKLFTAWRITFAAVTLLLIDNVLMSVRLSWLFRPQGLNLRFGTSLKLSLVGFFFATFLPGAAGGDLSKLFYTTRGNGGRRIEIMTVVLLDRAIGLFSLLLLPLIFAPMFFQRLGTESALRSILLTVGILALGMTAGFLACLFSDRVMVCIPSITRNRLAENRIISADSGNDYRLSQKFRSAVPGPRSVTSGEFVVSPCDDAWHTRSGAFRLGSENVLGGPGGPHRE